MTSPRICIAGIERESNSHLRPVTGREDPLTRELLTDEGGPFEIGAVVELGAVRARPTPPETEDHLFAPRLAEQVEVLDGDEYLDLIDSICTQTLEDGFGPSLKRQDWNYTVDVDDGERSLACVRARTPPSLEIDQRFNKLKLRFNDPDKPAYMSVSDLRFVEPDHRTLREDVITDVNARLADGVGVRIMFGLARAFKAAGDDADRHWLQVNGLCLEDRPLGSAP